MWLVEERDGNDTPLVTYTRGRDLSGGYAGAGGIGGLLARSHGYTAGSWSSHNFYHADGNGNVTALASSAGALQASYKYDPYGRYLSQSGTLASANVMRFSSKPWVAFNGSSTAGLYYYGYRFYDPYLQRWVNRYPIEEEGGENLYAFVDSSPSDLVDPWGLSSSCFERLCSFKCRQQWLIDCYSYDKTLDSLGLGFVGAGATLLSAVADNGPHLTPKTRELRCLTNPHTGRFTSYARGIAKSAGVSFLAFADFGIWKQHHDCLGGYLSCMAKCMSSPYSLAFPPPPDVCNMNVVTRLSWRVR